MWLRPPAPTAFPPIPVRQRGHLAQHRPWWRTEDEEVTRRDGMGLRSLELGPVARWFFRRVLGPGGRVLARVLPGGPVGGSGARGGWGAGGCTAYHRRRHGPGTFYGGGRAFQRLWLAATARLSIQPLAGVLLLITAAGLPTGAGSTRAREAGGRCGGRRVELPVPAFATRVPVMFFPYRLR